MRRALFVALVLLGGCPYEIPEGRFACGDDADCPTGFVCNPSGRCDRGERDAGPDDAGGRDDAPACDVDVDGDGACADVDCDDEDRFVSPLTTEVCTPSMGAVAAVDEDCDGSIDEACAYAVGEPHYVVDVLASGGSVRAPHLSWDGLQLYACAPTERGDQVPELAIRADTNARFGRFLPIDGVWNEGTATVFPVDAFVMSADGLEALVQVKDATPRVSRYTRTDDEGSFVFDSTLGMGLVNPSLSPDDLEFVAIAEGQVVLARREALGANFQPFEPILADDELTYRSAAFVGPDVLIVVVLVGAEWEVRIARRTDTFVLTEERLPLSGPFESVAYHPPSRELFFTSSRDWTPVPTPHTAIWRAEICRDGACPAREVSCDTASGEVRSPDGVHCYRARSAIGAWPAQQTGCGSTRDRHALTIHSNAELGLVGMLADDLYWTGGNLDPVPRWFDGEPWTSLGIPGSDDCVTFRTSTAALGTASCGSAYGAICESEIWPTW